MSKRRGPIAHRNLKRELARSTREFPDWRSHFLKHGQHAVAVLHSNRTQRERIEALEGFKSAKYEVMVATDIASRGLDIGGAYRPGFTDC